MAINSSSSSTLYPLHLPNTSSSAMHPILHVHFKLRQRPERTGRSETMKASVCNGASSMRPLRGSGAGAGAGTLDQPSTADPSQIGALPLVEAGGDIGRSTERKGTGSGDSYKVLLVDDPRHTEKLVEKALPQIVPSISPDKARLLFYESRERGVAIVIVTVKEHAEFYAQMMLQRGLRSAIEPDSSMEV